MANVDNVKDDELRAQLQSAHAQLRANKPTDAVKTLASAFIAMVEKRPELRTATVAGRRGRVPLMMQWPRLGANLSAESVREGGSPRIEFTRDKFAMSEALTYYEFTVDTAVREGM